MTAQTLVAAVTAIAAVTDGVSGITSAPTYPQENINERVFALTYVMTSIAEISEVGTKRHLATIAIDLITPLVVLSDAISSLLPIVDALSTALISEAAVGGDMFSGTIDAFENLRIEFLPFYDYSNVPHIGYRVILENAKLHLDL